LAGNPNLEYICTDEVEIPNILQLLEDDGITNCIVNSYCPYTAQGNPYILSGDVTLDTNIDGCDENDEAFLYLKFHITDGTEEGYFFSNAVGDYKINLSDTTYTISPQLENPDYFTVSPESITVTFPDDASPYIQDFCITVDGLHIDLELIILPVDVARPGFDSEYKIIVKNVGNTVLNGEINLIYEEELMDFLAASTVPDIIEDGKLTWNFSEIKPFEKLAYFVSFELNTPTENPPLNDGDILHFYATAESGEGDETPDNNIHHLYQTVVNSFDPNDKTCLEGDKLLPEMVGEYVHYMIRFENTGSAEAVNIVVKDVIDITKFDIRTLSIIDASHEVNSRITAGNIVEFIFKDIYLPFDDENNDGYVIFKIKTLASLGLGDTFSNTAEIYFDYNAAIITNEALTTVEIPVGTQEQLVDIVVSISPNPTNDIVNINSDYVINQIAIFSSAGQLIKQVAYTTKSKNATVNLSDLDAGIYMVNIGTEGGIVVKKVVVE
jgi:hypothetical protein